MTDRRVSPGGPFAAWRDWAVGAAARSGVPSLATLIEGLANGTARLRAADWNPDAGRREGGAVAADGQR
jgi:hypothetical protein